MTDPQLRAESFSSKIRNNTSVSTLTTPSQHGSTESPGHSNQGRKRNKCIQIEKEELKLSLFAEDMVLDIENSKDSTKKKKKKTF